MAYLTQLFTVALEDLQSAGYTFEADCLLDPLDDDCFLVGFEVVVTEALAGPGLNSAGANFDYAANSSQEEQVQADLMTVGEYESGGQQYRLQIFTDGCPLGYLTAGAFTVTLYYANYKTT